MSSPAAARLRSASRMSRRFPQQLGRDSQPQRAEAQIEESGRLAFDSLREATDEKVDPVLGLDDLLLEDQLLALVLANFGQETLHAQLGAAGRTLQRLGPLEAGFLKRDDSIQVLNPFVERHQLVIILGDIRDQPGHHVVPTLGGAEVAIHCRVSGIPQLPPDVHLPGEVGGCHEIWQRLGKVDRHWEGSLGHCRPHRSVYWLNLFRLAPPRK